MPKLTETTNDKRRKRNGAAPPPVLRITEAHEPLSTGEGWVNYAQHVVALPPAQPAPQLIMPQPAPVAQVAPLKIALIGTAPSSRMLAPFNDPSWKIWACSPGNMNTFPRVDAWFEIHSNLMWPEHQNYGAPYIEWLKKLTIPVFMQDQSVVPNAVTFPMEELVEEFGGDFFTSSFAWMMAFAIKQGASEIALYGIDMASRDEYILQRPGFYYFRSEARKKGIKVSAPHESDIMQSPPLYGYTDSLPFGRKLAARDKEIKDRLAQMIPQRDALTGQITYLQGAAEDNDYHKTIWAGIADEMFLLKRENEKLKAQLAQLPKGP